MAVNLSDLPYVWRYLPIISICPTEDGITVTCLRDVVDAPVNVRCLPEHTGLFSAHAQAFQKWDKNPLHYEREYIPVLFWGSAPRFFPEAHLLSQLETTAPTRNG